MRATRTRCSLCVVADQVLRWEKLARELLSVFDVLCPGLNAHRRNVITFLYNILLLRARWAVDDRQPEQVSVRSTPKTNGFRNKISLLLPSTGATQLRQGHST